MIGFSHLTSGAIIGATIANPFVAVPAAFISHLILDTFPHYGEDVENPNQIRWLAVTLPDGVAVLAMAGFLLGQGYIVPLLVGLVAVSPDAPFIIEVIRNRLFGTTPDFENRSVFTKFHSRIQQLERPWGWTLEIVYAVIFGMILFAVL